jgi:hypothetical protein
MMAKIAKKFHKASRVKAKASIMLEGLSGTGKTGLAITLSKALAGNWEDVYYIDTENKSMNLFVGLTLHTGEKVPDETINVINLTKDDGYAPTSFISLRDSAIAAGGKVVVKDSISHAWQRQGGVLDLVNKKKRENPSLDNYRVWGDAEVNQEKNEIFELIRDSKIHVITTVRVKEKFTMQYDEDKDKNTVVSLGEQPMQQEGLQYEPDLVLRMLEPGTIDGNPPKVFVRKSRYAIFKVGEEYLMTPEIIQQLVEYLDEGVDPDKLLEQQRIDYIEAVKEYCDTQIKLSIWKEIKKNNDLEDVPIEELTLKQLKTMHTQLIGG